MHPLWIIPLYFLVGLSTAFVWLRFWPESHRTDNQITAAISVFLWPLVFIFMFIFSTARAARAGADMLVDLATGELQAGRRRRREAKRKKREAAARLDRTASLVKQRRMWQTTRDEADADSVNRFVADEMLKLLADEDDLLARYDEAKEHRCTYRCRNAGEYCGYAELRAAVDERLRRISESTGA